MIELSNFSLSLDAGDINQSGHYEALLAAVAQTLNIAKQDIYHIKMLKRSVDARKKNNVHFVATLGIALLSASKEEKLLNSSVQAPLQVKRHFEYVPLDVPLCEKQSNYNTRPVVVGAGPCGLFSALYLAKAGLRPIVIERGKSVEQRIKDVEAFNQGATFNSRSNVQFGEGGAGAFSDGKLTTNTKNPYTSHVLHCFVEAGAPEEILWQAKPHIGTDQLAKVLVSMRKRIIELGGEIHFETQLVDLSFREGQLSEALLQKTNVSETGKKSEKYRTIKVEKLVLATGHSARDTFAMLYEKGLSLEQKPFSVGLRIEHKQKVIDAAQYGDARFHPALGAADYKLAVHLDSGRSVYTFCMCPGGEVVCAASEEETVVVNGMSYFARNAENANAAILVTVDPKDFSSNHPLAGIEFQRDIERSAYREALSAGGKTYQAPAQKLGDFLFRAQSFRKTIQGKVNPSYARGVVFCDLHMCLPSFVTEALEEALPIFDQRIKGFSDPEAILTGVETRSSSPVRICRNKNFQAEITPSVESGLYPCGEGSGYAGGIMSAAVDGLKIAEAIVRERMPKTCN